MQHVLHRELKVSHWCCTLCPGYSCNYSFGGTEVQLCAQGGILNWCISVGPNVVLPSFLLSFSFQTSPKPDFHPLLSGLG